MAVPPITHCACQTSPSCTVLDALHSPPQDCTASIRAHLADAAPPPPPRISHDPAKRHDRIPTTKTTNASGITPVPNGHRPQQPDMLGRPRAKRGQPWAPSSGQHRSRAVLGAPQPDNGTLWPGTSLRISAPSSSLEPVVPRRSPSPPEDEVRSSGCKAAFTTSGVALPSMHVCDCPGSCTAGASVACTVPHRTQPLRVSGTSIPSLDVTVAGLLVYLSLIHI